LIRSNGFGPTVGHFFSKDVINGKNVITVYRWDARDADNPVWSQASSEDNGLTWEWNWFMYMSKITKIVKFRIKENSERSITKKK
jgi:hypothetical protein